MESDISNNFIPSKFAKILGKAVFSSFFSQLLVLRVIINDCFHFLEIIKLADYENAVFFVRFSYDVAVIFEKYF